MIMALGIKTNSEVNEVVYFLMWSPSKKKSTFNVYLWSNFFISKYLKIIFLSGKNVLNIFFTVFFYAKRQEVFVPFTSLLTTILQLFTVYLLFYSLAPVLFCRKAGKRLQRAL
jgi:hypothetical protein